MAKNFGVKIQRKYNRFRCYLKRKNNRPVWKDLSKGYLVIFFDYEGDYALPDPKRREASYRGVIDILDLLKRYHVSATFNTVGKLIHDFPDVIHRIISEGHEIASHSYQHEDLSQLKFLEIDQDIKITQKALQPFNQKISGLRSPQDRWSFRQMRAMLQNGLSWSAEFDSAAYPYVICKEKKKALYRFPIVFGDYDFLIKRDAPVETFYQALMERSEKIKEEKRFGAVGFHPWIYGEKPKHLDALSKFLEAVVKYQDFEILTFKKACGLISEHK